MRMPFMERLKVALEGTQERARAAELKLLNYAFLRYPACNHDGLLAISAEASRYASLQLRFARMAALRNECLRLRLHSVYRNVKA